MKVNLTNNIKRKLIKELYKRLLIQFFTDKNYQDSFDKPLYPPICVDLPYKINELFNKIEICPFIEDIDQTSNFVKIGWNLFVLGVNRLYLGSSCHSSLADLRMCMGGTINKDMPVEHATTPKEVINFIIKILEKTRSGFVELPKTFRIPPNQDAMLINNNGNWPNFFGRPVPSTYFSR